MVAGMPWGILSTVQCSAYEMEGGSLCKVGELAGCLDHRCPPRRQDQLYSLHANSWHLLHRAHRALPTSPYRCSYTHARACSCAHTPGLFGSGNRKQWPCLEGGSVLDVFPPISHSFAHFCLALATAACWEQVSSNCTLP